jgi:hypothetical protein
MAAPNLKNPTTITGKTARVGLTTTDTVGIVTNNTASGKVLKINSIFAANIDGVNGVDVSVAIAATDSSSAFFIASTIYVPPDATQILSTKESYFYLEEGDTLRGTASVANRLNIIVSYEDIS